MKSRKRNSRIISICIIVIGLYGSGYAQDYYGGSNGSWRRKPAESTQPKDKNNLNPEPSGYMSINFGFADPEGNFGAGYGSGYGGYAQTGSVFHISMAFPINHSNFGIAFMFGSYSNNYDNTNFGNYLENSNSNPYVGYAPLNYGVNGGINNIYQESSIMGGLYATYPIGRLSIDGRLMVGALLNSLPEQIYGMVDTANNQTIYDLQTTYPVSFAVDAGIGVRCLIARLGRRQLCGMVNLDYFFSSVSYNATQVVDYTPGATPNTTYETYNTISGHLDIALLNITFGLGYQIGN